MAASKREDRSRASACRRGSRPRTAPADAWSISSSTRARSTTAAARSMPWRRGCARSTGGARILGVGHRVVHGGAQFAGPTRITPRVMEQLRALIPLAPLHQPHNLAAIDAVSSGSRTSRKWRVSTPAFIAASRPWPSWCRCQRRSVTPASSGTGFTGCRTTTSRRCCPRSPEIANGRVIVAHLGSGASACAIKDAQERGHHARIHGPRRHPDGHATGRARSRRGPLSLSEPGLHPEGRRDAPLQAIGTARDLRHQQRHARAAREQ